MWRYIVPALTVILVMVIILRPGKENIEVKSGDTDNVTNLIKAIPDTLISVNVNDAVEEQADTEPESPAPKIKTTKITKTAKQESESFIDNISELLNENEDAQDENEYYIYENDFKNLSPAEQNEVLSHLTNTKF
ncbi:MAG: hypothetical protein LWX07_13300 [Bacteroidetes bacterium]|nr:hypothetical protein [Bacteroidota bacterium]